MRPSSRLARNGLVSTTAFTTLQPSRTVGKHNLSSSLPEVSLKTLIYPESDWLATIKVSGSTKLTASTSVLTKIWSCNFVSVKAKKKKLRMPNARITDLMISSHICRIVSAYQKALRPARGCGIFGGKPWIYNHALRPLFQALVLLDVVLVIHKNEYTTWRLARH